MTSGQSKQSGKDIAVSIVAWAAAVLLFGKSLWWLAGTALAREQIAHAAVVLIFGVVFLLRDRAEARTLALGFGRRATGFYAGACLGAALAEVRKHLRELTAYAIDFLKAMARRLEPSWPRKTRIESFNRIEMKEVARRDLALRYDASSGYLGTAVSSGEENSTISVQRLDM